MAEQRGKQTNTFRERAVVGDTEVVHIPIALVEPPPNLPGRFMFLALSSATALLLAAAAIAISLEATVVATETGIEETYRVNFSQLLAQIYIDK